MESQARHISIRPPTKMRRSSARSLPSFLAPPGRAPIVSSSSVLAAACGVSLGALALSYAPEYRRLLLRHVRSLPARIYDATILDMTEKWYRAVLERLEDGSAVLDVGIGTAGALLRCEDLIRAKDLRVVGLDYNDMYVESASRAVAAAGLEDRVRVACLSVYDEDGLAELGRALTDMRGGGGDGTFDAVYFSGSISLLPDPALALRTVAGLLRPESGRVYVTQTYQRRSFPLLRFVKPAIKFLTTIDFGQLVMEADILRVYKEVEEILEVQRHEPIRGSIDSALQCAYLSVLIQASEPDEI